MLLDLQNGTRPEWRTTHICKELAHFNIDVAALGETRMLDGGRIDKVGSGYSIWKGKLASECQIYRVGFAVRTSLVHAHNILPKVIDDHLMSLHMTLPHDNFMTIISVYAPTLDSVKDEFY